MEKKVKLKIKPLRYKVNGKNSISGWEEYYQDGVKFMKTAMNGAANRQKFTPAILYNITAMAMEKYLMSLLMYYGTLPQNHTMKDLLISVKALMDFPLELERKMIFIDSFQEICSIEKFNIRKPDEADILSILSCGASVKTFVEKRLPL